MKISAFDKTRTKDDVLTAVSLPIEENGAKRKETGGAETSIHQNL